MTPDVVHMMAALRWKKAEFAERFDLAASTVYNWGDDWPAWAVRALRYAFDNQRLEAGLAEAVARINHPEGPPPDPAQSDLLEPPVPQQQKFPWDK